MEHELTMVKGIGPKTADLLVSAGIGTLKELARATISDVARAREVAGLEHGDFDSWVVQAGALVDEEEASKSSATGAAALEAGGETETETEPGPVAADAGATGTDAGDVAAGEAEGAAEGAETTNYTFLMHATGASRAACYLVIGEILPDLGNRYVEGVEKLFAFVTENPDAPVEALHVHAQLVAGASRQQWDDLPFESRLALSTFRHVALEILAEREREAQAAAAAERKRIDAELRAASAMLAPNTGMHGPQPDDHLSDLGKAAARRAGQS